MEEWQLQLYRKSLKKKEKIDLLLRHLPAELKGKRCLEVGCARGTVSYFLRSAGGSWFHTDTDRANVSGTHALLKDGVVVQVPVDALPFPHHSFDLVVSLDYLEHVQDDGKAISELWRVLKPGGRLLLSTPTTGPRLLLNRVKPWIGLTLDQYGHVREGYELKQLSARLQSEGYDVRSSCTYSRFFTELIEMGINFAFVKIFRKGMDGNAAKRDGSITIGSKESFEKHSGSLKAYSFAYPFLFAFTRLDRLWPFPGYALLIEAEKPPGRQELV